MKKLAILVVLFLCFGCNLSSEKEAQTLTLVELFKFSAEEAKRLDLELAFHNSAGWSSSGGPWVTEENAMQTVVFSELVVEGDKAFKEQLPKPETKFDYYKDIAVLAFPKPKTTKKIDGNFRLERT